MGVSVSLACPCTRCLSPLPGFHDAAAANDCDDGVDDDDDVHTLASLSVLFGCVLIFCRHYQ